MSLDRAEREILHLLQHNGRMSNVDMAEQVGLSESPCYRRVRQLEESGVISGYRAILDQRQLGLQVTAFVQVSLDKQDERKRREFLQRVAAEPHIVECHAMSGQHDYLLKVLARSMDHFSELSMQGILRYPGVKDMASQFSLKEIKPSSPLPIGES